MFYGEHFHALDAKGRLILPSKFRDQLAVGAFVAKSVQDRCLNVYTAQDWERVAAKAAEISMEGPAGRSAARTFFSGASDLVPDRQGRIAIPAPLRSFAGLEKDVVVAGYHSRIEIWDASTWASGERERNEVSPLAIEYPALGQ